MIRGGTSRCVLSLAATLTLFAAGREFPSYVSVKAILPPGLHVTDAAQWLAWCQQQDKAIRARLEQGDLDSLANLLLLGTSFTKQPRIPMDRITEASKAGILGGRVDDLVAGLRHRGDNERLLFVQGLLRRQGIDPMSSQNPRQPGVFLYDNLLRVVKDRIGLSERVTEAEQSKRADDPASLLERSSVFSDRGVSLDTGILPDFLIEQTLRDLKNRGVLREGQVARVALVGPGLPRTPGHMQSAGICKTMSSRPIRLNLIMFSLGSKSANARTGNESVDFESYRHSLANFQPNLPLQFNITDRARQRLRGKEILNPSLQRLLSRLSSRVPIVHIQGRILRPCRRTKTMGSIASTLLHQQFPTERD